MSELETLPVGWISTKLLDVSEIFMGQSPSASLINNEGKGLPFFQGKTEFTEVYPYVNKHSEYPSRIAEVNDLLMSVRAPVGPVNIANKKCGFGRGLCAIRSYDGVDYKLLFYQLKLMEKYIASLGTGSTFSGINRDKLETLDVFIPPENEQTRIVEKLEELLSDLDNGVAELKAAQIKLTQYRQSLLKSAVEGSLTAKWRDDAQGRANVAEGRTPGATKNQPTETGQQLLQRILEERRQRWEQQKLAEFKEKGKKPPKDWKLKYPEPVQPDTGELQELPEGWVWASVDQLAEIGTGVTPLKSRNDFYQNGTIPWVTSGAVNEELVTAGSSLITERALEECRLRLYPKGTLLVAMYGEGKTRGKCSELGISATINQALAALVLEGITALVKEYLKIFLLDSYQNMRAKASGGVQPNLNLQIVRSMSLPLPPIHEQNEIKAKVVQLSDDIDEQQRSVTFGLQATQAQRKNLLKDAFSGKLVPQDPKDEPASVLLAKIKAERAAQAKLPKPKRAKKKPNTMKNFDLDALKKWIAEFDNEHFTFADIEAGVSADYENLKNLIFLALSESKPVIYQSFDDSDKKMVFKKAGL